MRVRYPLKFKPVYKDYPWGNTRLPSLFGREEPAGIYAESWEVSTHPDGESVVANGKFAGRRFSDVLAGNGADILGAFVEGDDFPLLIKLIDTAKPLSVQVHPSNENAALVQGQPKTEVWYFLNDEPSQIYCGLKPGTSRADFVAAIERESFEDVLCVVPAEKGSAAFVPAGRVHAIDAGCLLLEIQQNSNTTYRVYDWGRVDQDGKSRDTHVSKALQVIDFNDAADPVCSPIETAPGVRRVLASDFFVLDELTVDGAMTLHADGASFHALFSAEGGYDIAYGDGLAEPVAKGESVLIPAALGEYTIQSTRKIIVLKTSMPIR